MRAEELKRDKYEAALDRVHMSFTPFVMESIGGFGPSCDPVLFKIGRSLAGVERIPTGQTVYRLKQQLQCKWMRLLGASLAAQAAHIIE
jgi:hypothetical protein